MPFCESQKPVTHRLLAMVDYTYTEQNSKALLLVLKHTCPRFLSCIHCAFYHNLLNISNKFQLINNSCFYFELRALLIIHSSTLDDLM